MNISRYLSTAIVALFSVGMVGCNGDGAGASSATAQSSSPKVKTQVLINSESQAVFNITQAMQAGLYYFNENALGPINDNIQIPDSVEGAVAYKNPVSWRGNSFVHDGLTVVNGKLVTLPNLNTGFADAGDTIKYNLPQAYAMMMLAWSGVEYKNNYVNSQQYDNLANVLRWGMNYMMNCWQPDVNSKNPTDSANSFLVVQTGLGAGAEHNLWVGDEVFEQAINDNSGALGGIIVDGKQVPYKRLSYYVNLSHPGPDVAGAMASAMAAGATFFANSTVPADKVFASKLYQTSQQVLKFAQNMASSNACGNSPHCIANQNLGYSDSDGSWKGDVVQRDLTTTYNDAPGIPNWYAGKLALASLWLAQASDALDGGANYKNYLSQGKQILSDARLTAQDSAWTLDWANFYYGAFLLLSKMDPNGIDPVSQSVPKFTYKQDIQSWVRNLAQNAAQHPNGLAYFAGWEALRYSVSASFVGSLANKYLNTDEFTTFAMNQLNYVGGQNPAHYNYQVGVSGIGSNNAANAHNATAQSTWTQSQNLSTVDGKPLYAHSLIGALVGGPANADGSGYNPLVTDYGTNEPTIDGNSVFVAALAAQYQGQAPFSKEEFPGDANSASWPEFYGDLYVGSSSTDWQGSQTQNLNVSLFNHSNSPQRLMYNQTAVLYFNFSDMPAGKSIDNVNVRYDYAPDFQAPVWKKLDGNGNYSLSLATRTATYPGGTWANGLGVPPDHRQAQLVITIPWKHNFNNDWSFQNLTTDEYNPADQHYGSFAPNIAIYASTTPNGALKLVSGTPVVNTSGSVNASFSGYPSELPTNTQTTIMLDGRNVTTCNIKAGCTIDSVTPGKHVIQAGNVVVQNGNTQNMYSFDSQTFSVESKQTKNITFEFGAPQTITSYTTPVKYVISGVSQSGSLGNIVFTDPDGKIQTCDATSGENTCNISNKEAEGQSEKFTVTAPAIKGYNLQSAESVINFTAGVADKSVITATYVKAPDTTCSITYKAGGAWPTGGGYARTINVSILNKSSVTIPATWTLSLAIKGVSGLEGTPWNWNASVNNGSLTGVASASWETIGANQTLPNIGANVDTVDKDFAIDSATLNGQPCDVSAINP